MINCCPYCEVSVKLAVVGAGFSGLAVSFHLLERGVEVDLYDQKGVGSGASGIGSGLVHPYAGEQLRRSLYATEGMEATRRLLQVAGEY